MTGILNNFMTNLQPMQVGAFNPVIDHRHSDLGGIEMLNQSRDAIARSKVEDMIRQAQAEGKPLNEYDSALIARVSPNATSGYNNSINTQNNSKLEKLNQGFKKQELENQWITDTARILQSSDPAIKSDVYKRQVKKAIEIGIHDDEDPTEYSPEVENQLVKYSESMLQEQKDARSYGGTPAALQISNAIKKALDASDLQTANAIAWSAKILDKGQEFKNAQGTIGNIEGYLPAVESRAYGSSYNNQIGRDDAFANQGIINKAKEIKLNEQSKINQAKKIDENKSLPPSVQKNIQETQSIINNTNRIVGDGIDILDTIQNETLDFGLIKNAVNNARNGVGSSSEESQAFSKLQTFIDELTNNVTMLAKGTQSDGDAKRAKNMILNNITDKEIVKNQLSRLIIINDSLISEKQNSLETIYKQNNKDLKAYNPKTNDDNQEDPLRLFK